VSPNSAQAAAIEVLIETGVPDISKKIRIEKGTVIQNIAYKNKFAIDIFNST